MSFRILSLDGGGIRGAFTASVLAALEADTGRSVAEHFDLIAGTSTGGIIALALGLGVPAKAILEFYRVDGPTIFPSTGLFHKARGWIRQMLGPKHTEVPLRQSVLRVLGDRKLGHSKCRLVIPAYDANAGRIFILKTAHHERFKYDYKADAVDVAMATSAAPTYFRSAPFPAHEGASYVDGGVWANSPALVAVTEALHFLQIPPAGIDVLSIGTTSEPFNIAKHSRSGIMKWNVGLLDLMFHAQMEAALAHAKLLANGNLHRMDYVAPVGQFSLDNAAPEKIEQLISIGRGVAVQKEHLTIIKSRFLNGTPASEFVPLYVP